MKNECVQCGDVWKVRRARLDSIDHTNLKECGQLYSVCEDCSDDGEAQSILKGEWN